MSEQPFDPFDRLAALHAEYVVQLEDARVAAAALLATQRADRSASPVAHTQWRSRLIEHSTEARLLRVIAEQLEELLSEWQEARVMTYQPAVPGVIHTPPVKGDEGPEPF